MSMAQMEYRSIGARLRPPRFVVGYRPGRDWIYDARQVVASISRVWGGSGAVIAPLGESGAMSEALASVTRAYDPDHIAVHVPILADLAHEDPEIVGKVVEGRARRGEDRDAVWRELRRQHVNIEGLDALAEQATAYFSPFKSPLPGVFRFSPGDIVWLHRYADSKRHLTTVKDAPGARTFVLDLSQVDPAIALMLESRIGSVDPDDRKGRKIIELPVMEEDLPDIIRLAITGTLRSNTWDLLTRHMAVADKIHASEPYITVEEFLADSPFARSGQSTVKIRTAVTEPPIVCVIGETADDHALALLCDRLFQHAAWVPTHLLADDAPLRTAVRMALYSLSNISGAPDRPVLITSISEPAAVVGSLAASLNDMFGIYTGDGKPMPDPRRAESISPLFLAAERGRSLLADPDAFSLRRYSPVANDAGDLSTLAPVAVSSPKAVEHLGADLDWCIDVWMPGHQVPARTSLTSDRFQRATTGFPEAIIRTSRDGLTFASPNFGLVMAGAPPEARLASPLLRFPSADVIFAELAAGANAHIERSTAGRRSAIAVEMWGSFRALADDLAGPVRKLLDAFLPPKGADGDYGIGYEIRGNGYVAIEDAAKVLAASLPDARNILDRLLTLNALRQGFLLYCARCRTYDFYRIEQVGPTFECHACGHASSLTRGQWYEQDPEPHWYYAIDQVVRDLLVTHGDVPLLAAADLGRGTSSLLWCPELEITDATGSVEIDICAVVDGRIVIGEAKSNATLRGDKGTEDVAKGLAHAAQVLSADEIVLATSRTRWAKDVVSTVRDAVSKSWARGPQPAINELTRVGS
jgi:hypothetical protein